MSDSCRYSHSNKLLDIMCGLYVTDCEMHTTYTPLLEMLVTYVAANGWIVTTTVTLNGLPWQVFIN